MKKARLSLFIALVLMLSLIVSACSNNCTVTFKYNNGEPNQTQSVQNGEKATKPTDPTKTDYKFGGWYKGETKFDFDTKITKNITLDAKWLTLFTVTFDSDGGSTVTPRKAADGETVQQPTSTKTGYVLEGWYKGETKFVFTTPITENITLKARWTALEVYTVTFDSSGGSSVAAQNVYKNGFATEPENPTNGNNAFGGWYLGETLYSFSTPVSGNITLVARWIAPVAVGTVAQLKAIGANAESMAKAYYLSADIDLSAEENWLAIGRTLAPGESGDGTVIPFTGILDGKGHKITMSPDAFEDASGEIAIYGLFKVNQGVLKNIWLSGNCGNVGNWAGALVVDNFGTVKDCFFDINIASNVDDQSFGSAICINNEGTITNCVAIGTNACQGSAWSLQSGLLICNNKNPGSCNYLYALGNPETELIIGWERNTPVEERETNCAVKTESQLKQASLYADFDTSIWNIVDGQYPSLKVQP